MKKIYILFMACALAFAVSSCSKDDDNSGSNNNNNTGGGGGPLDVWATVVGTYSGDETTSTGGTTNNVEVTITKISDTKARLTPGANSISLKALDIDVFKGDTSIYHQQGIFNGQFYIIANSNPPQLVLSDNANNVSYFGQKK